MSLTKYVRIAEISLRDHLSGRLRQAIRFLMCVFLTWTMQAMWSLIYRLGYAPAGIALTDMHWYLGIAQYTLYMSPRLIAVIEEDIRSGNLAYFLTRPIPYIWMRLTGGIGALCGMALIYFLFGTAALYLMVGEGPSGGMGTLLLVFPLMLLGNVIHLFFQILSGLTAFWTHDVGVVYYTYQRILLAFGGVYLPLSLYPPFFSEIGLPYLFPSAIVFAPAGLVLSADTLSAFVAGLSLQIFWIFLVAFLTIGVYKICLREVEVNGG